MKYGKAAEYVDPGTLVPWEKNPRKNDHAVDDVARSIKRYGFGSPITARLEDRMIISGHTRMKAAMRLGLDLVPCRFLDISRREAEELAIVDNKTGEIADWDDDILRQLIDDDFDIGELGWSDKEIDEILTVTDDGEEEGADDSGGLGSTFQVIVICNSESQMDHVIDMCMEEGLECRPLIM